MIRRTFVPALLALALSLPSAAATGSPSAPAQAPAASAGGADAQRGRLSPDWIRVRTANFEAVGNATAEDIQQTLQQLEVFRSNLVRRFLGLRTTASLPTLVVVFRDMSAFSRFKPRDDKGRKVKFVGAYFGEQPDMNLIVMPRMSQDGESLRAAFHEYFHLVVRRNITNAPTWLNEGLAEFYSTFRYDSATGESVVGAVPRWYTEFLRTRKLIPFDQLLSGEGAARILRSGDERAIATFYAESWALVHFLIMNGRGAGEAQVRAYLEDVARGMPIGQAFQSAFGVTTEDAARRLAAYVRQTGFPNLLLPPQADAGVTDVSVTPMTEAEAEYIQGDLLLRLGAEEEAERQLRKALALDPSSSATKVALATLLVTPGHAQEAIDALRPIADAEPRNLRAHLELAGAYRTAERYEDALAEYSRAAAINEQATVPWLGLAYSALALERYDESDKAMDHLMALEPNPAWYQSRAYEAFVIGNFAAAARDARTYIDKAGRGAESAPYVAFLGAICQRRLGHAADADALLADIRPELAPGSWTFRLMDFLQGALGAPTLLGSARDEDQRTEAHAYVGFGLLQEGHVNEALEELRWVRDHGTPSFVEHRMAVAELKRLEKTAPAQRLGIGGGSGSRLP